MDADYVDARFGYLTTTLASFNRIFRVILDDVD
jgi:hypothetical protein